MTVTRAKKDGSVYDIWFSTEQGRAKVRRTGKQILAAVQHYAVCPFKKDRWG